MDQMAAPFQKPLSQLFHLITHHWKDKYSFARKLIFFLDPYPLQASFDFLLFFPLLVFLLPLPLLPLAQLLAIRKGDIQWRGKSQEQGQLQRVTSIQKFTFLSSPSLILGEFWELTFIEHWQYPSLNFSLFSHLHLILAVILCRVPNIILTLNWGTWGLEMWDNMSKVIHLIISRANIHFSCYFSHDPHPQPLVESDISLWDSTTFSFPFQAHVLFCSCCGNFWTPS